VRPERFETPWTDAEDQVLRDNRTLSAKALAELLPGRTVKAISARRLRKKLRKVWLAHELDILKDGQHTPSWKLAELLPGRTVSTIQNARKKFGWPLIRTKPKPERPIRPTLAKVEQPTKQPQAKPAQRKLIRAAGCGLNY